MSEQTQLPNPVTPDPNVPSPSEPSQPRRDAGLPRRRRGVVWGAILITIGLVSLLQQFVHFDAGNLFLPMLAAIFLVAGIVSRRPGLIIPGGILAGIGAGAILIEGPFSTLEDPTRGGVFLLAFAGGLLLITLAALLINCVMLWPLIPGAFMAVIGLALVAGQTGLQFLQLAGVGWPIILIGLGIYLVFRRRELTK